MSERWFHAGRYERECAAFDAANPLMAEYAAEPDGYDVKVATWSYPELDPPTLFVGDDGEFWIRLPGGTVLRMTAPSMGAVVDGAA